MIKSAYCYSAAVKIAIS